jgi:agmatine/peptidylarginine deiminase
VQRLPAEWEPQAGVLLTWPHDGTDWAGQLGVIEALYARLTALIAEREGVLVVCRDADHRTEVEARLAAASVPAERIVLALAPSNDTWARDHGPITVVDDAGRPTLVDFRFDGWGGKFPAGLDDRITARLHADGRFGDAALQRSPLVLEGGAIDGDGQGTLLAVRRTVIDPARNPGWSRAGVEQELQYLLGTRRVLWLEHGALGGDDTDGHIDTLVRFCSADALCYVAPPPPEHPDHMELAAMERELGALRRPDGSPYRLTPLPLPRPIADPEGRPLPATYANFLIINGRLLVPVYGDPADTIAVERLGALFPDREVRPVDCRPLIRQGGSLHCVTMQLPATLRSR